MIRVNKFSIPTIPKILGKKKKNRTDKSLVVEGSALGGSGEWLVTADWYKVSF
jgi:hypothetical protein